ncbi:anti-repressor SinI family protein [Bacillus sp. REN10]|uniref:anti-repressor SinI family protein n=1 Tax=Bacillus sp. REN10 TaxID=2782541 RepID=UPI00193B2D21|nr:anti-repressor SinI family protein [Bacillus sp. REN10]
MERELEQEWVYLMMQAKQIGISIEEVRRFLQQGSLTEISHLENKNKGSFSSTLDT